ncbi:MAG: hypothetical protein WCF15_02190 [Pseudolabrys sp.]
MRSIMNNFSECDILVVVGAPAGSTIASLLAQQQKHVVVLEKERFPRFHIGESLLPLNLPGSSGSALRRRSNGSACISRAPSSSPTRMKRPARSAFPTIRI